MCVCFMFYVSSKSDMCREAGAVALIDDSVKYALDCAPTVEKVYLFGSYAWNAVRRKGDKTTCFWLLWQQRARMDWRCRKRLA